MTEQEIIDAIHDCEEIIPGERIVELNYDDMETERQKTEFNRLWEMRVKR